jgi:hypothetical protein
VVSAVNFSKQNHAYEFVHDSINATLLAFGHLCVLR